MSIRIYQNQPLVAPAIIQLDAAACHHLARVLRVVVRDSIIVFNGLGGEYKGVIQQINKKTIFVELQQYVAREAESALNICLAQGISRGEKMDYTIQKAVELGVKCIVPLFTEYCNVKLDAERGTKKLLHWQSIVRSACEQSGRNRIPEVMLPTLFSHWLPHAQADYCFVFSPHAENKLKEIHLHSSAKVVLLIGPEGGLSEQEINQARQQNFLPLSLGPRVLRTETAALAAITAMQSLYGDMGDL